MVVSNAVFGIGGITTALFPDVSSRTAFTRTTEYVEIMQLIESLQQNAEAVTASGKFSVRIPRSLHAAL